MRRDHIQTIGRILIAACLFTLTFTPAVKIRGESLEGELFDFKPVLFDDDEYAEDLPQPDGNGTLYFGDKEVPKRAYKGRDDIKKVVFKSGIKNIKKEAFMSCHNLSEVVFPEDNTLKYIYKSAFEDCTSLARFICPDTKMEDGQHSGVECEGRILYGDSALTELKLGAGLWHFGKDSFYKADKLTSVTLPEDLHNINGNIFRGCTSLKSIEISDKNQYFLSHDGVLYEKLNPYYEGERSNNDLLTPILYAVPSGKVNDNAGTFVVPKNVTTLGPWSFYGDNALKKAVISEGNERLGRGVFEGCESLTTVVLPETLKYIGEDTFKGCSSLKEILYAGTEEDWEKIQLDIYTDSARGDNHTYFVTERVPFVSNMDRAGINTKDDTEESISDNTAPDNTVSDNTVSDNTVSGNTASGDDIFDGGLFGLFASDDEDSDPDSEETGKNPLLKDIKITFEYDNIEESTDDAAEWEGVTIMNYDMRYPAGCKFNAGAYLGTKGQKGFKYESSNKKSVKVNSKGIASVKGGNGEVTITVKKKKSGDFEPKSIKVNVESPVMVKDFSGGVGDTISANKAFLSGTSLKARWYSSKPSVAEVNEKTGKVTLKAPGKARIYAVFCGKSLKDKNGTRKKYKTKLKVG